jgi:G3E family GTPase
VRAAAHGLLQPGWLFGARPITAAPPVVSARMAARHTDGVRCVVLSPAAPVPAAALALLLRALAEQADGRLLRAKGLVHVLEQPGRPALVQGVQHVFEAPEWLETWPDGERETRLVLIASAMPQRWPSRLYAAIAAEVRDETARRA